MPDRPDPAGPAAFDLGRWQRRVRVALGHEPADLVLTGADVVDVFGEERLRADIAIADGVVAGVGDYPDGLQRIDLPGRVVAPAFVDAHIHTESSLVWVTEFARAVVPRGTGAIVTDPHELANVAGLPGLRAMRQAAVGLPLVVRFTAPSCVPASPAESPGATFGAAEIAEMLTWPETVGLGELMNFPGTLAGDADIGAKLAAAAGHRIDGHSPGVGGASLQGYVASGPGSDHESTTLDEARAKLRAGLMVMIREGASARNLAALLPLVTDHTYPRCCFCSDDRDCHLLLHEGHVDAILRQAVAGGLDPLRAIRLATWNPAHHWGLRDLGAVAPGFRANLAVLADLDSFKVEMTFFDGRVVARDGRMVADAPPPTIPPSLRETMRPAPIAVSDFALAAVDARQTVVVVPGQIATGWAEVAPTLRDGRAVADPGRDLLKLACVERHHQTGRVGVGYVQGFGLRRGALASSIAHDAHNIVVVGADDADMLGAVATVVASGGGLAAVADGEVLAHLPLPVAGILSDRPLAEVAEGYAAVEAAAAALGSTLPSPFGLLAFLALSVIPEARVTDRGFLRLG